MSIVALLPTLCLLSFLALTGVVHAGTVSVAVASNFTAPMQQIAAQFAQDTGHQAVLLFGATGKFYAQIHHGAPFGVLLAADSATPHKIAQAGKGVETSRFTYAIGQLALWSQQAGYVDSQGQVLKTGNYAHIAVANPKLAPYGAAAMQVLEHMGVTAAVTPKIVQGENIGQTYQFTASGNAPLGFVALSQVVAGGKLQEGSVWVVPATMHTPIRQDAIVLNNAKDNPAAWALMEYLKSDKVRSILRSYGYVF